jgi:hypothetical protein
MNRLWDQFWNWEIDLNENISYLFHVFACFQVFEAIATEYEIKDTPRKHRETLSAYSTPNRSPNVSPAVTRRGQYQLSLMNRKKTVQFNGQSYGSDPNIHRSSNHEFTRTLPKATNHNNVLQSGNTNSNGHLGSQAPIPQIRVEDTETVCEENKGSTSCQNIQHKLVARLRQACSMADLQNGAINSCQLSRSLSNLGDW